MRVSDALIGSRWAIQEDWLLRMDACEQELTADTRSGGSGFAGYRYEIDNGVATVPLKGVIFQEATFLSYILSVIFGGTVLSSFVAALQAADEDPAVRQILIDVNSPGGEALGIEAAAQVIRGLAKPASVFVDGMAASAAYWLASAARGPLVLSGDTSMVGSIGTVLGIRDTREADSKAGVKRHEFVSSQSPKKRLDPATEQGAAELQAHVDQLAEVFIQNVAATRGVTVDAVKADFGQGAMVLGPDAVKRGMVDAISSRGALLVAMRDGGRLGGSAARVMSKGAVSMTAEEKLAADKAAAEKAQAEAVAAATAAGVVEGRKLERARFAAILGCEEAKGRQELALALAGESDMDAAGAKKVLAAAPVKTEAAANPLAGAMAQVPNPKVGAGAGESADDAAAEAAKTVAAFKAAQGVK